MIAHPLPALALCYRSKNIESALEVVRKSVSNLHRFMFGMIRRKNPVNDRFRAVNREVTMQLDHGVPWVNQLIPVHLDFVIILSARWNAEQDDR